MSRIYSLAYLTSNTCTPPQSIRLAAQLGYTSVGLRLMPNVAGAPHQFLINKPEVLRETVTAQRETGVGVFDLEIIRIGAHFAERAYLPLFEAGAALQAKAVLVAGDDTDEVRLADGYARLCELMQPYGLTADLEFMPWTGVPDVKAALRIIKAAGRPANAGLLVDALHFDRSSTTLDDIRTIPRELLHYAQICDAPTRAQTGRAFTVEEMIHAARCERLLPGEGGIDVGGLFDALPHDLPVSVEVVHLERMAQLGQAEWARQCLVVSRSCLEPQPELDAGVRRAPSF
ncbi:MAG: Xylose isomerase domain protein barrel [Polaromonas sp.]|nr:Xylose isomerase domain protein barrel [Polaromonas sp.]